jgi:hypothetical protein
MPPRSTYMVKIRHVGDDTLVQHDTGSTIWFEPVHQEARDNYLAYLKEGENKMEDKAKIWIALVVNTGSREAHFAGFFLNEEAALEAAQIKEAELGFGEEFAYEDDMPTTPQELQDFTLRFMSNNLVGWEDML